MKYLTIRTPIALVVSICICACSSSGGSTPMVEAKPQRLQTAEAMFQERCKKSGSSFIGLRKMLTDIFDEATIKQDQLRDQFVLDDPYGRDLGDEGYIQSFVRGFETRQAQFAPGSPPRRGYNYVEAIDPKDGKRYRYTGSNREVSHTTSILMGGDGKTTFTTKDFVLDKVVVTGQTPRFGVTYDDISTREEREYWIAGSSLKVIDLQTNEVMAERIGYMMDRGQGNTSGGRSPWLLAAEHACPGFQRNQLRPVQPGHGASAQQIQTEDFVEKILTPTLEK
ncbi:MAG: hypothetical protein IPP41_08645 [Rhodocyclaceae bacterium]|nr:hypothetical protein [Rhodocyclaceae bacterium]